MKSSLIRFFTFATAMVSFAYLPIFARDLGISDVNIGIIVAFYSSALFFSSYIFGRTSDKYGRKLFILVGLIAAIISFFLQIFANDFTTLLLVRTLVGFCIGIYPSALVAYVYERKENLNRFASFGSLGWFFGLLISGIVAMYFTINGVFILSSLFSLISFLVALFLESKKHKPISVPFFPIKIIKKNRCVYSCFFLRHTGAAMIWTFWPLYLLELGADLFWVGIIQAINSIVQFFVMYIVTEKFKSIKLVRYGILLSIIAFFSFTLARNFWEIIPTQFLLGISWGFLYVGVLRNLTDKNVEKATVSGILDSVINFATVIGPFLATLVISFGDYRTTMYVASFLSLASFLIFNFSGKK